MDDVEHEMHRNHVAMEMYTLLYKRYACKKKYVITTIELAKESVRMADELINELNRMTE